MKTKTLLIATVVVLALVVSAWAADVTGKWVAQIEGRQGTTETTFNFKVDGTTLTGTMASQRGEDEISEGKVEGDEISFVVVRSFGENEIKLLYKGKVAGDEITFTRADLREEEPAVPAAVAVHDPGMSLSPRG